MFESNLIQFDHNELFQYYGLEWIIIKFKSIVDFCYQTYNQKVYRILFYSLSMISFN